MRYNKCTQALKKRVSLAAMAALSLSSVSTAYAQGLKEVEPEIKGLTSADISFNQWRDSQRSTYASDATDQFIVEFASDIDGDKAAKKLAKKLKKALKHKKTLSKGQLKHVFKLASKLGIEETKSFLDVVRSMSEVKSVELDPVRYLMSQTSPWGISRVQADQLSDASANNLTVCIIDSGYERSNPDLNANNHSGTNDPGTGNWYQAGGSHGTHVAGTIAAVNNSEGVVGVLPEAKVNLHIVKVFNESGWGYSSDLASAVNTCVSNGANIVNMSLGGPSANNAERNALEAATAQGVLLIAASGNDGNSSLSYPASYDTVMAVGALDENNQHAEFSQYTPQVEISAPGEAILSTVAGDGRLGSLIVGSTSFDGEAIVPQSRYVQVSGNYQINNINGSVSGELASCSRTGSSYSCGTMTNKICLVERHSNQSGSSYPEIDPAKACADAGASGIVVYSNTARPGTQNPFLVDGANEVNVPIVSVNRSVGQAMASRVGQTASLTVVDNQDYAYYNGTSMATPHVAAVAALAWSNNLQCSNVEVREALKQTALDVDTAGRDDRTGYGLVQAKAASDYLSGACSDPVDVYTLENGIAFTPISGSQNTTTRFMMQVPAGATNLSFTMSGGTGDADMYVRFGSEPTSATYDCRPFENGNNESCDITNIQAGTYFVHVVGYSSFTGVQLLGSYTEPGTPGQGYNETIQDISATTGNWKYYAVEVPNGMASLNVDITNGSGDADLHVRYGAQPTTTLYDCRPFKNGNTESCSFTNPTVGTWHIGVRAYSTYSNVDLSVSYQP
ncbi:S8 family serine peptidase [Aestuariibacter sp. AA17]|uniref:S8 family serine peptidase n=1 Tax=Fluctibacter corallii TaxID=2984329 RepID=A0ABT3A8P4_9ALTE|nr:S8 family serine peptidase [Aestuariibacter sp. AA17]MCV2885053.1 S8 family serine peptidase [Aestuariibacter sp. AA17]